jgi:exo-beta-1,3-glucanase (GH17 family)
MDFEPFTQAGQSPVGGSSPGDGQIRSLLSLLQGRTLWIKTAGSSSGQERIPCIAKSMGFSVAAAAYLNGQSGDAAEISHLEANIRQGCVDVAVVGSEAVWHEYYGGVQAASYINQVRAATAGSANVMYTTAEPDELYRAGSPGHKYGAADVQAEMAASDIYIANIPPFNYGDSLNAAIPDVNARYGAISAVARSNTRTHANVWIGETEWPSGCDPFGNPGWCHDARVNPANAASYFQQFEGWAAMARANTFYYEAIDNVWAGQYDQGYGNHWGIFDNAGNLKPGFQQGFPHY